jgi:hypothetical protein
MESEREDCLKHLKSELWEETDSRRSQFNNLYSSLQPYDEDVKVNKRIKDAISSLYLYYF